MIKYLMSFVMVLGFISSAFAYTQQDADTKKGQALTAQTNACQKQAEAESEVNEAFELKTQAYDVLDMYEMTHGPVPAARAQLAGGDYQLTEAVEAKEVGEQRMIEADGSMTNGYQEYSVENWNEAWENWDIAESLYDGGKTDFTDACTEASGAKATYNNIIFTYGGS